MLYLALAFLGTAGALALLCPRVLAKRRWQLFHPRAALTIWFGSFGLGAAIAFSGVALGIVAIESVQHAVPHSLRLVATEAIWVAAGISGLAAASVVLVAGSLQSIHPESHSQVIA